MACINSFGNFEKRKGFNFQLWDDFIERVNDLLRVGGFRNVKIMGNRWAVFTITVFNFFFKAIFALHISLECKCVKPF